MRYAIIAATATTLLSGATAWPGMKTTLAEIEARADTPDAFDSYELIGDLVTLPDNKLSATAKQIKTIITGGGNPEGFDAYIGGIVPSKDSALCKKDTCCIWQWISNDMYKVFKGPSGRCTAMARRAVRLGFHDAAGWSKSTGTGGGADGSIILAPEEMQRGDNNGLQEIVAQMKTWYATYNPYGVSMADLIQMGATVAAVTCPLGPRVRSYVGRKDSNVPCTDHLLPGVEDSADYLIKLFQDKTIMPHGLTALIGAHTTSQQRFVNASRAGDPQDSTPGVWDVKFYGETLNPNSPPRVFKFDSDVALSQDSRTSAEFKKFTTDQSDWNEDYAREYIRVSLLGVYNINTLTECTKVLPPKVTSYSPTDQDLLTKWLSTTGKSDSVTNALFNGELLSTVESVINGLVSKLLGGLKLGKLWKA